MNRPRILLVDDDEDVRVTLQYGLESKGCEVITASDGFEALELADREHPDIILLDLILPKMDGYKVCRALKESNNKACNKVPIIIITGRGRLVDKKIQAATGVADYIVKPFTSDDLMKKIRHLLSQQVVERK